MNLRFYKLFLIFVFIFAVDIAAQRENHFSIDTLKYEKYEGKWYYNERGRLWRVIEYQMDVTLKENMNYSTIDFAEYGLPGMKVNLFFGSYTSALAIMPYDTDFVDFALKLKNSGLFKSVSANTAGEWAGSIKREASKVMVKSEK